MDYANNQLLLLLLSQRKGVLRNGGDSGPDVVLQGGLREECISDPDP